MSASSRWLRYVAPLVVLMHVGGVAAGQTLAWEPTSGPAGGTITALFEAPTGTLLAGTETAGVFRSVDRGERWTPSFEGMGGVRVNAITAVSDTLFAATEVDGVYRSDDDGRTWAKTAYWRRTASSLVAAGDSLIAGDEDRSGLLRSQDLGVSWTFLPTDDHKPVDLAATESTLYISGGGPARNYRTLRSRDGGISWDTLFRKPFPVVYLVRVHGSTIFAVRSTEILRSDDDGDTWTRLGFAANIVDIAPVGDRLYVATSHKGILLFSASAPVEAVETGGPPSPTVILAIESAALVGTSADGLWRSDGSGAAWRRVHLVNSDTQNLAAGGGAVYVTTDEKQVHISRDAGTTWTAANQNTEGRYVPALAAHGDLVYALLWLGDILRSADRGATWTALPMASVATTLAVVGETAILLVVDHGSFPNALVPRRTLVQSLGG